MAKSAKNRIGGWAFLIGVILAVLVALFGSLNSSMLYILVVLGLIIGILNIADAEATPFLMSGAVLIIASSLGQDVMGTIPLVGRILDSLLVIFVPATVVVAIRNVFTLARN